MGATVRRGEDGRGGGVRRVDVELVEDPAPEGVPGLAGRAAAAVPAGSGPSSGGVRPPTTTAGALARVSRRRWWWAAAALLVAVVVADVVREPVPPPDPAAYADVPGVVATLQDPVTERWRLPVSDGVWPVADAVVTADADRVRALDAGTGDVRWSVPLPDEVTTPPLCPYSAGVGEADRSAVVCFVHTGAGTRDDPRVARFGVVGTAQGTLLRQLSVPQLVGSAQVGDDLVVMALRGSGVTVARHDLARGEEVWRTDLPGVLPGPDGLAFAATDDVVWAVGRTTVVLGADDGRELGRLVSQADPLASWTARVVPRDGEGFGLWSAPGRGRWFGPDGTPGPELDGEPVVPAVQDASTPGILLLRSTDGAVLRAVDTSTGEEQWVRPAPVRVLLRLGGRLVFSREGRLTAVDTATGRDLWSVPLEASDRPDLGQALTDGVRVAVRGRDGDGRGRLTAYSLDTGASLWRTVLPPGARGVQVVGDRLAAVVPGDGEPVLAMLG